MAGWQQRKGEPPSEQLARLIIRLIYVILIFAGVVVLFGSAFLLWDYSHTNLPLDEYIDSWVQEINSRSAGQEIEYGVGDPPLENSSNEGVTAQIDWVWHTMELYHLEIEAPSDWMFQEYDRSVVENFGQPPTMECSKYRVVSSDGKQVLRLFMQCGGIGGSQELCPVGSIFLDNLEGLAVVPDYDEKGFSFTTYHIGNYWDGGSGVAEGPVCLFPPILIVNNVWFIATYEEVGRPILEMYPTEDVIRMVRSIR